VPTEKLLFPQGGWGEQEFYPDFTDKVAVLPVRNPQLCELMASNRSGPPLFKCGQVDGGDLPCLETHWT
jgi:hypothetical protein